MIKYFCEIQAKLLCIIVFNKYCFGGVISLLKRFELDDVTSDKEMTMEEENAWYIYTYYIPVYIMDPTFGLYNFTHPNVTLFQTKC